MLLAVFVCTYFKKKKKPNTFSDIVRLPYCLLFLIAGLFLRLEASQLMEKERKGVLIIKWEISPSLPQNMSLGVRGVVMCTRWHCHLEAEPGSAAPLHLSEHPRPLFVVAVVSSEGMAKKNCSLGETWRLWDWFCFCFVLCFVFIIYL